MNAGRAGAARTRCSLCGASVVLAASPKSLFAQRASGKARIGLLGGSAGLADPVTRRTVEPLLQGLRERGWVEGQNLGIEWRFAEGQPERLPVLQAELIAPGPDVLVTYGPRPALLAKEATRILPVAAVAVDDPVQMGLVVSLARPGGNITGVSLQGQEIIPKALSLLHEAVPQARRFELLGNAANPAIAYFGEVLSEAARELGLQGQLLEVRSADEIDAVLAATRADALLMLADPLFFLNRQRIADAAIRRRLPLGDAAGRFYTLAGNLLSYAVKSDDIWLLAAVYADRILRSGKPAETPIEQPSRYELFINLKTAKAIGVTIQQALLLRADEVIE